VTPATWTFERERDRLAIAREERPDGVRLSIILNGSPRSYHFPGVLAARRFQADMETFLVHSNWSFVMFSDDRRRRRDRRGFPRTTERRRWWTDGVATPQKSRLTHQTSKSAAT
jgi:hypothetical protein